MMDFRSNLDKLGSAAKSCRFAIRILPSGTNNLITSLGGNALLKDLTYLCETAEFPGRGFDFVEARYYGPAITRPYNTKYTGEFSTSILIRQEAFERQLFDDWLEVINPTKHWDLSYPETYFSTIDIYQLAEYPGPNEIKQAAGRAPRKGQASYLWRLIDAWPMQVNPQQVTWADNDILRLQVTFAYTYWIRPGRDDQ
jgi:hypothetical protein